MIRVRPVPLHIVGPVTVARDGWDWLGLWSTIAALAIAVVAIVWATKIAGQADRALIRERRNAFELDVLVKIIETCTGAPAGAAQRLKGLLLMISENELTGLRDSARMNKVPTNAALEPYLEELRDAVRRRLTDTSLAIPRWRMSRRSPKFSPGDAVQTSDRER